MANFDEVKIIVTAIGADGFDYESDTVSYLAIQEPASEDPTDETGDDTDNEQTGDSDEETQSGGMSVMVIGGIAALVFLVVIAGVLGAVLLRGGRNEPTPDWRTDVAFATPAAAAPPAAAPVVNSVPDYTQLTPGGQYVTGHAGETVYLAPDGTAWTMQADSSFIRTS